MSRRARKTLLGWVGCSALLLGVGCGPNDADDDSTPADDDSTFPDDDTGADDDGTPPDDDTTSDDDSTPTDGDGDGAPSDVDCDDTDPSVHPGAAESCDGRDEDCSGAPDDPFDADGDGAAGSEDCPPEFRTDCDDSDPAVHPGAIDACGDGVDSDCTGDEVGCRYTGTRVVSDAPVRLYAQDYDGYLGGGDAVAGGGDINADGFPDLVLGIPWLDIGYGVGLVAYGSFAEGSWDVVGEGGTGGDGVFGDWWESEAGTSVAIAGDVDGDGYDDVLVGAPNEFGALGEEQAGIAYFVSGPVEGGYGLDNGRLTAYVRGTTIFDRIGAIVASAGDVDGDGFGDILVGGRGPFRLFYGPVTGALTPEDADATLQWSDPTLGDGGGTAVAGARDVNGDGLDDVLYSVGENAVALVLGPLSGPVTTSDGAALFTSDEWRPALGTSVALAGDVNGDGVEDVVLGAMGADGVVEDAGAIYVFHGPFSGEHPVTTADATLMGEGGEGAGHALASTGDVNQDGYADFLVGAYRYGGLGAESGEAYLVYGPVSGTVSLPDVGARFQGDAAGDRAGYAVAGVGDLDSDGYPDFIIGAPRSPGAYLFWGRGD
ncbi:MAG: FG-GAP repeat protein [Candidatus Omnitrophica bacterium]|nr:FG-GAP-like repeat-containing protein [Myxococcota bacterium]NUN95538.1 FG-GAP repeat protein [Candidatus Omnitrophota bacterium]